MKILVYLNITTLFFLRGVNKKFDHVIAGTTALQEILFSSPMMVAPRAQWRDLRHNDQHLLWKSLSAQTIINTLLQRKFPAWFSDWHLDWNSYPNMQNFASFKAVRDVVPMHRHVSWRNMLVCQPPIHNLRILLVEYAANGDALYRLQTNRYDNGIRMGTMFDIVQKFMTDGRSFGVDWCEEILYTLDPLQQEHVKPLPEVLLDLEVPRDCIQHLASEWLHLVLRSDHTTDLPDSEGFLSELQTLDPDWAILNRDW